MVEHAIHNQVHATLVHLCYQLLEVLHVAQQRVKSAIIYCIIAMVGAGTHHRVYINGGNAQILQIVQLLGDTCQIAAEEVVAILGISILVRSLAMVCRNIVPIPVLDWLAATGSGTGIVVGLVTVKEAVRENLAGNGFLGPVRGMVVSSIHCQLERLGSTQCCSTDVARTGVITVLKHIIQQEGIAVHAVFLRGNGNRPDIAAILGTNLLHVVSYGLACGIIRVVLVTAVGSNLCLGKYQLGILHIPLLGADGELDSLPYLGWLERSAVCGIPGVMYYLVRMDAAIVNNDFLASKVVVEAYLAVLADCYLLLYCLLPLLLDFGSVSACLYIQGGLIELVHQEVAHYLVTLQGCKIAAQGRELCVLQHFVAVAVLNLVGNVVIIEGNFFRLVKGELYVGTIEVAVEAVILCPAAVDGNLVEVRACWQVHGVGVEAVADILHLSGFVGRVPVLGSTGTGLDSACYYEAAASGGQ